MKAAIMFDKKNILWTNSNEANIMQIKCNMERINNILMMRGYIYLNQIYEYFEAHWDAQRCNHCILYDGNEIRFEIHNIVEGKPKVGYLVDIIW